MPQVCGQLNVVWVRFVRWWAPLRSEMPPSGNHACGSGLVPAESSHLLAIETMIQCWHDHQSSHASMDDSPCFAASYSPAMEVLSQVELPLMQMGRGLGSAPGQVRQARWVTPGSAASPVPQTRWVTPPPMHILLPPEAPAPDASLASRSAPGSGRWTTAPAGSQGPVDSGVRGDHSSPRSASGSGRWTTALVTAPTDPRGPVDPRLRLATNSSQTESGGGRWTTTAVDATTPANRPVRIDHSSPQCGSGGKRWTTVSIHTSGAVDPSRSGFHSEVAQAPLSGGGEPAGDTTSHGQPAAGPNSWETSQSTLQQQPHPLPEQDREVPSELPANQTDTGGNDGSRRANWHETAKRIAGGTPQAWDSALPSDLRQERELSVAHHEHWSPWEDASGGNEAPGSSPHARGPARHSHQAVQQRQQQQQQHPEQRNRLQDQQQQPLSPQQHQEDHQQLSLPQQTQPQRQRPKGCGVPVGYDEDDGGWEDSDEDESQEPSGAFSSPPDSETCTQSKRQHLQVR